MEVILLNLTILILKVAITYFEVPCISNIYVDIDIQMDIPKIIAVLLFSNRAFSPKFEIKVLMMAWFLSETKCIDLFILHSIFHSLCVYSMLSCIISH